MGDKVKVVSIDVRGVKVKGRESMVVMIDPKWGEFLNAGKAVWKVLSVV